MDKDDILGTLKGVTGLAGKLAARGVDEVAGVFRKGEPTPQGTTGLYYQRRLVVGYRGLLPGIELFESQERARPVRSLVKNLTLSRAERGFVEGCYHLILGDLAASAQRFGEAVAEDAQLTDGYFLLGSVHLVQGEALPAAGDFQKALLCQQTLGQKVRRYLPSFRLSLPVTPVSTLAFYPDLLGLNVLLALAQREAGRRADAVQTLEQLLGVMPSDPVALFFLSLLRLELGRYRQVVDGLRGTLPDSNLHLLNLLLLGLSCAGLGDPVTARDIYRKALERRDIDPTIRLDLRRATAEALAAEGFPGEAEAEFRRLRQEDPEHRPLLERLGLKLGEAPLAPPRAAPGRSAKAPAESPRAQAGAPPPEGPEAPEPARPPSPPTTRIPDSAGAAGQAPPAQASTPPTPGVTRLVSECGKVDFVLPREPVVLGREEGHIVLSGDSAVSRTHARVMWEGKSFWVEDLGSTNGTWVNGHRISRPVEFHHGDVLQVGNTRLRLE